MATQIQRLDAGSLAAVYQPHFDLQCVPPEQIEEWKRHSVVETFPTAAVIVLHFVTLGIFTLIFFGLKHSKLPRIRSDDFGAGRAIGFIFIPLFNLYWIFVFWLRLADRINFQFRLRSQVVPVSRGLVWAALIILLIPYVGLVSSLVLFPIILSEMQSACNALAVTRQAAAGGA